MEKLGLREGKKHEIEMHGDAYVLGGVDSLTLKPSTQPGIRFVVNGKHIEYTLENLHATTKFGGKARFNVVSDEEYKLLVPEHIVSGICLATNWNPAVEIHISSKNKHFVPFVENEHEFFLPQFQAGVKKIVDKCSNQIFENLKSHKLGIFDRSKLTDAAITQMNRNLEEKYPGYVLETVGDTGLKLTEHSSHKKFGTIERYIQLDFGSSMECHVKDALQLDLKNTRELNPTPVNVDYMSGIDLGMDARAMGRLGIIKPVIDFLNGIGFLKGINSDTYFKIASWYNTEKIKQQMNSKYNTNEHLYHTLVSDFPGELYALLSGLGFTKILSTIHLHNTNHSFRVTAMKIFAEFHKQGFEFIKDESLSSTAQ